MGFKSAFKGLIWTTYLDLISIPVEICTKRPALSASTAVLWCSSLATFGQSSVCFFLISKKHVIYHTEASFFLMVRQPLACQGLPMVEAPRSHSDTPHSVGLPWTSVRPVAGTLNKQHTALTRGRHLCTRRDSNPNPKKQAADNQYFRPRSLWIRHTLK